jgi:hypothetical protein
MSHTQENIIPFPPIVNTSEVASGLGINSETTSVISSDISIPQSIGPSSSTESIESSSTSTIESKEQGSVIVPIPMKSSGTSTEQSTKQSNDESSMESEKVGNVKVPHEKTNDSELGTSSSSELVDSQEVCTEPCMVYDSKIERYIPVNSQSMEKDIEKNTVKSTDKKYTT